MNQPSPKSYEYAVIPAPQKNPDKRAKKLSSGEALSFILEDILHNMTEDGWEYMHSQTLSFAHKEKRFKKAEMRLETVLIFRREILPE